MKPFFSVLRGTPWSLVLQRPNQAGLLLFWYWKGRIQSFTHDQADPSVYWSAMWMPISAWAGGMDMSVSRPGSYTAGRRLWSMGQLVPLSLPPISHSKCSLDGRLHLLQSTDCLPEPPYYQLLKKKIVKNHRSWAGALFQLSACTMGLSNDPLGIDGSRPGAPGSIISTL